MYTLIMNIFQTNLPYCTVYTRISVSRYLLSNERTGFHIVCVFSCEVAGGAVSVVVAVLFASFGGGGRDGSGASGRRGGAARAAAGERADNRDAAETALATALTRQTRLHLILPLE